MPHTSSLALRPATGIRHALALRVAARDVLLVGERPTGDARFELVAHWPSAARGSGAAADASLLAETLRQTSILLAYRYLGARDDAVVSLGRTSIELDRGCALRGGARELVLTAAIDSVHEVAGTVSGFRCSVTATENRADRGTAVSDLRVTPAAVYARLRDGADGGAPSRAGTGGVHLERSREERHLREHTWRLSANDDGARALGHSPDHLTPSQLLDAIGAACRELTGWDGGLVAVDIHFSDFDRPSFLTLCPLTSDAKGARFALFFEQDDSPAVIGAVTIARG